MHQLTAPSSPGCTNLKKHYVRIVPTVDVRYVLYDTSNRHSGRFQKVKTSTLTRERACAQIDTNVYETINRHSARVACPKTLKNFNSRFTYWPGRAAGAQRGARSSYLIN